VRQLIWFGCPEDDMAWAKPLVDEAEVARGAVISLEEHEARTDARLAAMR
jgi:hypothetical protein